MNPRGGLLALLYVLGLSAHQLAAASSTPVSHGLPLYGRVAADVATFSTQEILDGFGSSRPRSAVGQVARTLPRGGRFVKFGGPYIAGAFLFSEALNWFYNQAQQAANPTPLSNWWNGSVFPAPLPYTASEGVYQPGEVVCRGYVSGLPRVYYVGYNSSNRYYFGLYTTKLSNGSTSVGRGGAAIKSTYKQSYDLLISDECKRLSPEPLLSEVITGNPSAAKEAADIMRQYVENHPEKLKTVITFPSSVPNVNEESDDSVDCTIDSDGDGQNDCDELRRGPGVAGPGLAPLPGNVPSPADGAPSDPSDPASKSPDTDKDGVPDYRDNDDDNDGMPDDKDPEPKTPGRPVDTDNDDIPDDDDPDDDNDGIPDDKDPEPKNPTDPVDTDKDGVPDDKDPDDDNDGVPDDLDPDPKTPEPEPVKCGAGYTPSPDGKSCVPKEDDPKCPDGYTAVAGSDPVRCEKNPEDDPKEPVSDSCGDFSVKRLMVHTGNYIRDVFFSCDREGLGELRSLVSTKFPFSLIGSLNTLVEGGGGNGENPLPTKIGPFELDWVFASSFFAFAKLAFRAVLWFMFASWLIGRLSGQVVIQ